MPDADYNLHGMSLANPSSQFPRDLPSVERPAGRGPVTLAVTLAATLAVNYRLP